VITDLCAYSSLIMRPLLLQHELLSKPELLSSSTSKKEIYKFSREYFEALAWPHTHGAKAKEAMKWRSMNDEELSVFLTELFVGADEDNSGELDKQEFMQVMQQLQLSRRQIKLIFDQADEDGSGLLEYEEFLPIMIDLLKTMIKMQETKEEVERMRAQAKEMAEYMVRGMTSHQLEKLLVEEFHRADVDGSGQIDVEEMGEVLKRCGANMTREETHLMFLSIDADDSGYV
jgi:Ca2+-binding EF-hand superfamily protein